MRKAYWGPEIRVGVPQPALNLGLDGPHDNVEVADLQLRQGGKELPVVFIQEPIEQGADPDPDPGHHPAQPAARRRAAAAAEDHVPQGHGEAEPARRGDDAGIAYAGQHSDSVFGTGTLDVAALRPRAAGRAQLVGVRGAGEAVRRPLLRQLRDPTLKRGEYTQTFTLARNGLISTVPTVPA